jgi:nitrogen fixation/metabolism regulation signal transduction histidine kinase
MTLSLSSFVFAEMNNDNLTQAFEQKRQEWRILEDWKTSSEYQKYISLGWENSPEAKQLMADTITKLTKERLQIYLSMLDPAKKDMFEWQINKFSPRARVFLRDLNKRVIAEIWENEAKNITKDMYIFVQSVDKSTWKSIELLNKILDKYPKLKNNKTIIEMLNTSRYADQRRWRKELSEMRRWL